MTPAEAGGTIQYSTDGGTTWGTTAPTYASNGSDDGPHTVKVRQVDAAGNLGTAASITFTLDTQAPAAPTVALTHDTALGGDNSDLVTSNGTLSVTPAEAGGTIQYSTDGGTTWGTTAPTYASNGSDDGPHTVKVRQVDAAGNLGTRPRSPSRSTRRRRRRRRLR